MAKLNHTFALQAFNSGINKLLITSNDGVEDNLLAANPSLITYSEHLFRDSLELQIIFKDTGASFNGKSLVEGLPVVGTEDVKIDISDAYGNNLDLFTQFFS